MPLSTRDEALALARGVVEQSSAAETEVTVESTVDAFVRFADSGPTQCADRERTDVAVRVRVERDGGLAEARATCVGTEPAALRDALERALALARVAPLDPDAAALAPLGGPVDVADSAPDAATLAHPFEEKAAWVARAVGACVERDLAPAGLIETTGTARALCNSAGRAVFGARSRAAFALTASGAGGAGFGESIAGRVAELDVERAVSRAVDKALASSAPAALEPGEYTVVLEPSAVSSLLLFASYQGFGAREVEEQASFLCGRLGERVFAEALTVHDDASNEVYPDLGFDAEGTPRQRVALIDGGRPTRPVTDRNHAAGSGAESTGHSLPQPNTHGPMASNLVVEAGSSSLAELCAGVERGLLVTQLHYTNMIEPRELTLTGMTRNGTFLIENGRLGRAVRNLRFTDTLVRILANVTGIGAEREVAGALFDGEIVTPALRIDGFRFTSTTDF